MDIQTVLAKALEMLLKQITSDRPVVSVVDVKFDQRAKRDLFVIKNVGTVAAVNVTIEDFVLSLIKKGGGSSAIINRLRFEFAPISTLPSDAQTSPTYNAFILNAKGRNSPLREPICLQCLHYSETRDGKLVHAVLEPVIRFHITYGDPDGRQYETEIETGKGHVRYIGARRRVLKERLTY